MVGELKAWADHSQGELLLLRHMLGRLMSVTERVTEFENNNDETNRSTTFNALLRYRVCLRACPGSLRAVCPRIPPLDCVNRNLRDERIDERAEG